MNIRMRQFFELILLAFKRRFNFLHDGHIIYNNKTKLAWSIWSERYKACKELSRLCEKYPEERDNFEIIELH